MLETTTAAEASYQRDLGAGLILRWSTAEDTESIAELCGQAFKEKEEEPPNEFMLNLVRRLMRGDHPLMGPGDYAVVEDTTREGNRIVACTCLWRQEWEYEGIAFPMGRPEIVAANPAYRKRGLIRAIFEMVHARSEAEGHLVQAITGIPYFYRQFGYEYALNLGGKRGVYLSAIPKLKEGESEPYALREAGVEDIPFVQEVYKSRKASSMVWTNVPDHYWRYELEAWKSDPERNRTSVTWMIVDSNGEAKGYIIGPTKRWGSDLGIWEIEVAGGVNLQAMMPSVLRALQEYGLRIPTRKPDAEPLKSISFVQGRHHPVYDALGDALAAIKEPPYAWYVRVRDVPAFLRLIAPVLEKRLESSVVAGYTGELKVDMYRGGLRLVFDKGRLTTAENWIVPAYDSNAGAGCPPLVFLQLLFGYRSLNDLRAIHPDVWVSDDKAVVLESLFPAKSSYVVPL